MSKHLQHAPLRVVNLVGHNSIRIPIEDFDDGKYSPSQEVKEPFEEQWNEEQIFLARKLTPLRGRTFDLLESSSTFRLRLYYFLSQPWTKPLILRLIILNACVLISQASHTVLFPLDQTMPTPQKGFFRAWEDYVLLGLFILFTLEAVARICVYLHVDFEDRFFHPFKLSAVTPSRSTPDIVPGPNNSPPDTSHKEKAIADESSSCTHPQNPSQQISSPVPFSQTKRLRM
ncbi:hypothetical protein EDB19DRAFT_1989397 [Suillus lakei]|nr:hypothetical protein EDB19DRAFT_1989397 [Suillus lakei]